MSSTIAQEQEKRQYQRVPVELDVSLHLVEEGRPVSVDVTIRDVSLSGLGILPLPEIKLQPNQSVEVAAANCAGVEARVQWCNQRGMGLHITQKPERVVKTWVGHVLELQGHRVEALSA